MMGEKHENRISTNNYIIKVSAGDFPGGPVYGGSGFNPWSGN